MRTKSEDRGGNKSGGRDIQRKSLHRSTATDSAWPAMRGRPSTSAKVGSAFQFVTLTFQSKKTTNYETFSLPLLLPCPARLNEENLTKVWANFTKSTAHIQIRALQSTLMFLLIIFTYLFRLTKNSGQIWMSNWTNKGPVLLKAFIKFYGHKIHAIAQNVFVT